jgi:hypothetical protein
LWSGSEAEIRALRKAMKKKARASAARTAKRRKGAPAAAQALVRRAAPVARPSADGDGKAEIRRL